MDRRPIRFTTRPPRGDRRHFVTEDDVRVVLARIPDEVRGRLSGVHLNDRFGRVRTLGYVNRGRREIGLCAVPPRISLGVYLRKGQKPEQFGAVRRCQWPTLAVRRFVLYDVLLHELGHLQIVDSRARNTRRKFARETRAQAFAEHWCRELWSRPFDHPDPAHNPPPPNEIEAVRVGWGESWGEFKKGLRAERAKRFDEAFGRYSRAVKHYPANSLALERLGVLTYVGLGTDQATDRSVRILGEALRIDPALAEARLYLAMGLSRMGRQDEARRAFHRAIRIDPYGFIAMSTFADSLADWECYDEAERLFARTLRREPRSVMTIRDYGRCLLRNPDASQEAIGQALALFKKAVAIDPSDADSQYWLGAALLDFGDDIASARRHLEQALRQDDSLSRAAEALEEIREMEEAANPNEAEPRN